MKTIYIAGGCFWGIQKFFDQKGARRNIFKLAKLSLTPFGTQIISK